MTYGTTMLALRDTHVACLGPLDATRFCLAPSRLGARLDPAYQGGMGYKLGRRTTPRPHAHVPTTLTNVEAHEGEAMELRTFLRKM